MILFSGAPFENGLGALAGGLQGYPGAILDCLGCLCGLAPTDLALPPACVHALERIFGRPRGTDPGGPVSDGGVRTLPDYKSIDKGMCIHIYI